jgi:Toprim-like/Protein of unknown function (DUF3991)
MQDRGSREERFPHMIPNDEHELDRIKAEVRIADLAIKYGYQIDKRASCKTSFVLRHEAEASKIVVAVDSQDGHDIFFDVFNRASGSVLDFVMFRERCNLGRARQILRERLSGGSQPLKPVFKKPEPIERDLAHCFAAWQSFRPYSGGYLESRGLTPETIRLFSGQIRLDRRGNTVFAHRDLWWVLTGWEAKNTNWTGFSGGGCKSLFRCFVGVEDDNPRSIIVTESAIDAMSYWQVHKEPGLYLSFGGGISDAQKVQLRETFEEYDRSLVEIATDGDEQGEAYYQILNGLHAVYSRREGLRSMYSRRRPPEGYKDWNDVVRQRPAS